MEENMNDYETLIPDFYQPQPSIPPSQSSGLSIASLVMGICSLILICCGGSFILGALGIIFALLSRGRIRMNGQATAGLTLSIIGIVLSVVVYTLYFVSLITSGQIQDMIDSYDYYYNYGNNFDDYSDYYDSDDDVNDDYLRDLLDTYQNGGEL